MEGVLAVLSIAGAITLGAIVALALSAPAPAAAYLRWKAWIDRAAGGVMGLLGVKLIHDAGR